MRRPETLHPAALLVDQHRRPGVADAVAHLVGQGPHLVRAVDVAAKDDEAPRPDLGEEGLLVLRQPMPAASVDRRRTRHRRMQSPPEARMAPHRALACS